MARGSGNEDEQDIHGRHPGNPTAHDADGGEPTVDDNKKSPFSWPGKDAKAQQAARDAHFKENGVKADLTGGVVPESE